MNQENVKNKSNCKGKKSLMFAFGIIQLSTKLVSAISLIFIALSLTAVRYESKLFNDCVEETGERGKSYSTAVRYCNGGR